MEFNSFSNLTFEIRRIRQLIKDKRESEIETVYHKLNASLKVNKQDIEYHGSIAICSSIYSYNILSIYLLLDMIDRFWDGNRFIQKPDAGNYFLYDELSKKEPGETLEISEFDEYLDKLSSETKNTFLVFMLPYKSNETYVLKEGQQGHILIIYSNEPDEMRRAFFQGVADFYVKVILKKRLPNWTRDEGEFQDEFIKWLKGENSKFKKK